MLEQEVRRRGRCPPRTVLSGRRSRAPATTAPFLRDADFEKEVASFLGGFELQTLSNIAANLGMREPSERAPKQFGYQVVARLIDSGPATMSMLDLEKRGVSLKTVRAPSKGPPFESTSFPAFLPNDLIDETWESSTLRRQLSYILFIILQGRVKSTPLPSCAFGGAFFYAPSSEDWRLIREDWELYRRRITDGRSDSLPRETETNAIHVRPHGRDSLDLVQAPGRAMVTRSSFWLNRGFVERIMARWRHSPGS